MYYIIIWYIFFSILLYYDILLYIIHIWRVPARALCRRCAHHVHWLSFGLRTWVFFRSGEQRNLFLEQLTWKSCGFFHGMTYHGMIFNVYLSMWFSMWFHGEFMGFIGIFHGIQWHSYGIDIGDTASLRPLKNVHPVKWWAGILVERAPFDI